MTGGICVIQQGVWLFGNRIYEMKTFLRREKEHDSPVRGQVTTSKLFFAISLRAWSTSA
jgi:hypothetical protein